MLPHAISTRPLNDVKFPGYNSFGTEKYHDHVTPVMCMADDGDIEYETCFQISYNPLIPVTPTEPNEYDAEQLQLPTERYSLQFVRRTVTKAHLASQATAPSLRVYAFCNEIYRQCCFSAFGLTMTIVVNLMLVLMNVFLVIYEAVLISQHNFAFGTNLPEWFFICDLLITIFLILEVLGHWYIGYDCDCRQFVAISTWDNKVDVMTMLISVVCCALYATDFGSSSDIDNLLFLSVRISRDIIRIIRCFFFFRLLHGSLSFDFGRIQGVDAADNTPMERLKSVKSQLFWKEYVKRKRSQSKSVMSMKQIDEQRWSHGDGLLAVGPDPAVLPESNDCAGQDKPQISKNRF